MSVSERVALHGRSELPVPSLRSALTPTGNPHLATIVKRGCVPVLCVAAVAIDGDLGLLIYVSTFCDSFTNMARSEEHTSELQSHLNLVCRLLLEKKKIQLV